MNKNNKMFYPLLIATIVIWGTILYNILNKLVFNDIEYENEIIYKIEKDSSEFSENMKEKFIDESISYRKITRDPFSIKKTKVRVENTLIPKNIKLQNVPKGISYQINGVVINENKRLVILNDLTHQTVVFLREGESHENLTVEMISYKKVTLLENGEQKEIILKN